MRRLFTLLVLLVAAALPFMPASATGSTTLFNDMDSDAYGLRVTFTEFVSIVRAGEGFVRWEAEENGKTIVFFEGKIGIWEDFFFFWEPGNAEIMSHHWLLEAPSYEPAISSLGPDSEDVGGQDAPSMVYLDVPKLQPTPRECLDCKTYALISVMRYYGDETTFDDVCEVVGSPPGPEVGERENEIEFQRGLVSLARQRGFTFEVQLWDLDRILEEVKRGRPVIVCHSIGGHPSEPGVVKGTDGEHVWVYGVWEALHQPGVDFVYTLEEFESRVCPADNLWSEGYSAIWPRPHNCRMVHRDPIPEVGHMLPSSQESEVPATIRWLSPLRSGVSEEIEITIYDEDYISWEDGKATARFAVVFDRSLGWGSVIQNFANKRNWSLPGRFFEEVQVSLEISESGVGWRGTVTIVPCTSMHYLSVLQPPQPDCPNITVRALVDDE